MKTKKFSTLLVSLASGLVLTWTAMNAQAVPSFARQTGMPCSGCHTKYPELNQFGRSFKLNGYTLTGINQIQQNGSSMKSGLKINQIPAFSAMLQVSATHMNKSDPSSQNNSEEFPQEASLFYAGEISKDIGSFIQLTYDQASGSMGWDNSDIRFITHFDGNIWGFTLNNNPTVQDVWNTTPAWGFPFVSSEAANAPSDSTAPIIDDALAQDVLGAGTYVLMNGSIYGEITLYRSAHQGTGNAAPDVNASQTIKGLAPYWRLAYQTNFGDNYLMVGTYGMKVDLYPDGVFRASPTDNFTDVAVDAQYERMINGNQLTVRGTFINETRDLNYTYANGDSANKSDKLKTFRINATYHFGTEYAATIAHFNTSGDKDAVLYADNYNGNPQSSGEIFQATFLPAENVQLTAQYTLYNKFNGTSSKYDGTRNASDNDTLYLMGWFTW